MLLVPKDVEVMFDDCVVEFKCPYCGHVWKADSRDGVERCFCGATYELRVALEVVPSIHKKNAENARMDELEDKVDEHEALLRPLG